MRFKTYAFFFLFTAILFAQEHQKISGVVRDAKTNEPIPFATVGIKGQAYGTVTNVEGSFAFYVPSDRFMRDTLSVNHLGFEAFEITIQQALAKGELDVKIREKVVVLDEVVVNAEQLTANQIVQKALDKVKDNFSSKPFVTKGVFRDIRQQNNETAYLVEAAVDVQDPGYSVKKSQRKKFYIKAVRAADVHIDTLLKTTLLNSRNTLIINLEQNYWLNWLRTRVNQREFTIADVISRDGKLFYVITCSELTSKNGLGDAHKDMQFELFHRYHIETETFAIHKVEHLENPVEGKYVAIERPYPGDSLFYSKKGWNQVTEFEQYNGKLYIKYQEVNYKFDIVNALQESIYLDMSYRFTFTATEVINEKNAVPEGIKMDDKKSLFVQGKYDPDYWNDPANAKLVPLTRKQIKSLERARPLEAQFNTKRTKKKYAKVQ